MSLVEALEYLANFLFEAGYSDRLPGPIEVVFLDKINVMLIKAVESSFWGSV